MTIAIETRELGKRYGRRWGLRGCSITVPAGRVVGLVGANGAGKTTLLHLAAGLLRPSAGEITVLGATPGYSATLLARVGFLAQGAPLYDGVSVADHLRFGAHLNSGWDQPYAEAWLAKREIDLTRRVNELSGGQRAQVALALAVAKRPDLLLLDEPVASLDPLARRAFLQSLMEATADEGLTVVMSSHLIGDLERVCDYLIVLSGAEVRVAGDVEDLLADHQVITGRRRDLGCLPPTQTVVQASHTDRQTTAVIRTTDTIHDPHWQASDVGLEDLVLAY